jgi:HPt (histidine-containing phosphotransfer) domain-containing protein
VVDVEKKNGTEENVEMDLAVARNLMKRYKLRAAAANGHEAIAITESDSGVIDAQTDSLLLESFIRDAKKTLSALEGLTGPDDFESAALLRKFTVCTHGIKSSLLSIGETGLSQTARSLEEAGRKRNITLITALTPDFVRGLRELLERLEAKRDAIADAPDEDAASLRGKLLSFQEACANYDRKGALDIIYKMRSGSEEAKAIIDRITEHLMHSEFEEAGNLANMCVPPK